MKLASMFAIALSIPSIVFAGPLSSGGGNETVSEGSGSANVMILDDSAIILLEGQAAQVLFEALEVKVSTPPFSTSQIKLLGKTECTKNETKYFCMVGVETR